MYQAALEQCFINTNIFIISENFQKIAKVFKIVT